MWALRVCIVDACSFFCGMKVKVRLLDWQTPLCLGALVPREHLRSAASSTCPKRMMSDSMWSEDRCLRKMVSVRSCDQQSVMSRFICRLGWGGAVLGYDLGLHDVLNPLGPRPPITAHSFFLMCDPRPPGSSQLADASCWVHTVFEGL